MSDLTHFDGLGNARMVDVGDKDVTERLATAKASVISVHGVTLISVYAL